MDPDEAVAPLAVLRRTDGEVVVRPIDVADADRLRRFHEGLSPEAVRWRFFACHPHLTEREVARFTGVDHVEREALVGLEGDEVVAVGRYDVLPGGTAAEVAFVVADRWQHQGIARALLELLATEARAQGVQRFVAITLPGNHQMMATFRSPGWPLQVTYGDGVVHVSLDLTSVSPSPAQADER